MSTAPARCVASERVLAEDLLREPAVDDVVGTVVVHRQLFEDDVALVLELVGPQRRRGQHVTEQLDTFAEPP